MKNCISRSCRISDVTSSCSRSFSLGFLCFFCFVLFFAKKIMSLNCLCYEKKKIPSDVSGICQYIFGYFVYKKRTTKKKPRNEIVLYFIYNRTFQYSDMSLIYLFTNIFIHFVQVWKSGFCIEWMFLYGIWPCAIIDVSTCLHSNYMQINYFEIKTLCCWRDFFLQ